MTRRLLHHHAIIDRALTPIASVLDFRLSLAGTSDAAALPVGALPYCVDVVRERMLFTCHTSESCRRLAEAPFVYHEQWLGAGGVLSVPIERLGELGLSPETARPIFIFSPGRCATTLLTALLRGAGLACASEPDMFSQLACLAQPDRLTLKEGTDTELAGICVAGFARLLGPGAVLKLRSHANARPLMLLEAAPGSRAVFVLRRAGPWALSRHRAFDESPARLAGILCEALSAFDTLDKAGLAPGLVWHESIITDPVAALRHVAPTVSPDARSLAAIMAEDSQHGTALARETIRSVEIAEAFFTDFATEWNGASAHQEWGPRTQDALARMFQ